MRSQQLSQLDNEDMNDYIRDMCRRNRAQRAVKPRKHVHEEYRRGDYTKPEWRS